MDELYYSVREVAERLKVTVYTVREWIKAGKLEASKIGGRNYRISESALKKFIEEPNEK